MYEKIQLFIEQIVEQELEEEAVKLTSVINDGLALYEKEEGGVTTFTLYSPKLINTKEVVFGLIEVEPVSKCKAWRIVTSSAKKGFGPLMYDIAFSFAGNKGLISDRMSVSDQARKVWTYNFTNRKNEFDIVPLDPNCTFKGRPGNDHEALNYKYVAKAPIDFSSLITNHENFLETMTSSQQRNFLELLEDEAGVFFNQKYWGKNPST